MKRDFILVIALIVFISGCKGSISTTYLQINKFKLLETNISIKLDALGEGMFSYDVAEYYQNNKRIRTVVQRDTILTPADLPFEMTFLNQDGWEGQPASSVAHLIMDYDSVPDTIDNVFFIFEKKYARIKDRLNKYDIETLPYTTRIDTFYGSIEIRTDGYVKEL